MRYEFSGFALEPNRRSLTLRGRELSLQPKAFDVLVYLVEHRERVVGKDELLDALWPGVVVSDGSLKRAVNLARAALREGALQQAIRTYPRQGYRFSAAVEEASPDVMRATCPDPAVDLEQRGLALHHAGKAEKAIAPLQEAVAAFTKRGDLSGAARCALHLAHVHFERRELAVGRGWLQRGATLLSDTEGTAEHGHRAWLASRFAIAEGEIEEAVREAELARDTGRRLGNADLESLGLLYKGLALVALGDVERGCAHHDEAAAAVLAADVSPWVGGLVYCGMIFTCRNRADWLRAAEWTNRFHELCAQAGLVAFPGTCRMHRAEVLHMAGASAEAEQEAKRVCRELADTAPWAEGEAFHILGDLHRAGGALEDAEAAYRRAYELGWDPQPGLALLHVAKKNAQAGLRSLERALAENRWTNLQRRGLLLSQLIIVALAADSVNVARTALSELERRPELWRTPALEAAVLEGRAALCRADGDTSGAVTALRRAVQLYCEIHSPPNQGRARLHLADALIADGDRESAELELEAAARVIAGLDAPPLKVELERVRARVRD